MLTSFDFVETNQISYVSEIYFREKIRSEKGLIEKLLSRILRSVQVL